MVKRYFKITYRNALKNKYVSLLNIFGLSIGLACPILITSWVMYELSFDQFFANSPNIYRVNFNGEQNKKQVKVCSSPQGVGAEGIKLFPEIKNFVRFKKVNKATIKVGEQLFYVDDGLYADSTFFSVFSFKAKLGNLSQSLNKRNQIVLTEDLALKCFGNNDPMDKVISVNNINYTVSAVLKNIPQNSHIQFQYLIPTLNLSDNWHANKWKSDNCFQYLLLKESTDIAKLEQKLSGLVISNFALWKELKAHIQLQPLREIHFSRDFLNEYAKKGNKQSVYFLLAISFLVLIIACVNFTNIFIASLFKRVKSTGVKIISGAKKKMVIGEFTFEVSLFILLSFGLALLLVLLILPAFNSSTEIGLNIQFTNHQFLLISLLILVITFLLAGLSPGVYITRINIIQTIKSNSINMGKNKNRQLHSLLTVQFTIAIILLVSVIAVQKQLHFLQNKELGFSKNKLICVSTNGTLSYENNINKLKTELLNYPEIEAISVRSSSPVDFINGGQMYISSNPDNKVHGERVEVGEDYFSLMEIEFIEGEQKFNYDNNRIDRCIINLVTADKLQLKPPYCGQYVFDVNRGRELEIIGVIKNINTKSLINEIRPCLYTKSDNYNNQGIILFKIAGDIRIAIEHIQDYCQINNNSVPFDYFFMDDAYAQLYKSENFIRRLLYWFSFIAITLTALGLLAISFFVMERRTKEIGIRKVNGATISEVMLMLNTNFIQWIAISFIIAVPIAYFAVNKWLESFAYKTTLSWWIFAFAGVLTLGIALLTVSWLSWKATTRNPVEALRYE